MKTAGTVPFHIGAVGSTHGTSRGRPLASLVVTRLGFCEILVFILVRFVLETKQS